MELKAQLQLQGVPLPEIFRFLPNADHSVGFGGKFGVQKDRQDKSAFSWAHKEETTLHESQTGGCTPPAQGV